MQLACVKSIEEEYGKKSDTSQFAVASLYMYICSYVDIYAYYMYINKIGIHILIYTYTCMYI